METYFETNRNSWNARLDVHLASPMYNMEAFLNGASSLKDIEMSLLKSVRGKKILHLQCHFGQDTLSLARLGAEVTGIDLSDRAIQTARKLSAQLGLQTRFVCGNVLETESLIDDTFDLVYTSYGVIGWLPDLQSWAGMIHNMLNPGGEFLMVEFHPVMYMFDEAVQYVKYPYFNRGASVEEVEGTYADPEADLVLQECFWNHSLADVINPLMEQGLEISHFSEYDYSPWDCFQRTVPVKKGFQIDGLEGKLPMVFALKARKGH